MKNIQEQLIIKTNELLKTSFVANDLADTPNIEMGQFALPCFRLTKDLKKAPGEIASDFAGKLNTADEIWQEVVADGAYLNFKIKNEIWNEYVLEKKAIVEKQKEKIMIEYSQPNTHKEFHVGHLRTACLGNSLVKVNRFLGNETISANYIGDTGVHVAKCLWKLIDKYGEKIPYEKLDSEKLGNIYAEAVQSLNENEDLKKEVSEVHSKLESGELKELWQKTKDISMEGFYKNYDLLGIEFDEWFWESEEEVAGKELIAELMKSKEIKQIYKDNGAIIANLQEFGLDVLVLVKSDGNALYGIKDLPLGKKKFDKYKVDKSIYVVDNRQSLYMKQIFKLLDLMGYDKKEKIHVAYDFVTLPDGAMASRKGNVITFASLYDEVFSKVKVETSERHKDWSGEQIDEVAGKIAMAAIKFFILKYENNSVIVFDIEKAIAVEGATGPYLLYSVARLNSILRKLGEVKGEVDYSLLKEVEEGDLIKYLSRFYEVVEMTASKNQPSYLCTYLLELAQKFNTFYHKHSVVKAEDDVKVARARLLEGVKDIFKTGLELLNIDSVEEM